MQKMIEENSTLLKEDGLLNVDGYCKKMHVQYNKENVKNKKRLKEWDYYYVADRHFALCLTISDIAFASVLSASVIDFSTGLHYDKTSLALFPKTKAELPLTSTEGKSYYKTKDAEFTFVVENGTRHLFGTYKNFYKASGKDLVFDIVLDAEPKESMVKVTPFKNTSISIKKSIACVLLDFSLSVAKNMSLEVITPLQRLIGAEGFCHITQSGIGQA